MTNAGFALYVWLLHIVKEFFGHKLIWQYNVTFNSIQFSARTANDLVLAV